jgi:hypothetical protein
MIAPERLEARAGESRQWGLVAWGGAALRRAMARQERQRAAADWMERIIHRLAGRARRRRRLHAVERAIRQALGLARPL